MYSPGRSRAPPPPAACSAGKQHFLYFRPLPHGHASFRFGPTIRASLPRAARHVHPDPARSLEWTDPDPAPSPPTPLPAPELEPPEPRHPSESGRIPWHLRASGGTPHNLRGTLRAPEHRFVYVAVSMRSIMRALSQSEYGIRVHPVPPVQEGGPTPPPRGGPSYGRRAESPTQRFVARGPSPWVPMRRRQLP